MSTAEYFQNNQKLNSQHLTKQSLQPGIVYHANVFTINLYEDWQDKTIPTLTGPVTDGIQHNIIITHKKDIQMELVVEYAD